ncbi:F-box/LRR-repeat protein At3g26922-like isoform X2 [Olea europaea var. sylvestris]|uniref:F-box/LRR-repeat protein At3g26922-like isoform X2 n=1 Tax=Olea europaea var. sylvestris TaxID=158386 RepID=UPI000C1CEFB1|nr:F-box/LRR-repeat protein At3g26922-like isoform X2 [Olea europaea var. sylvestris]
METRENKRMRNQESLDREKQEEIDSDKLGSLPDSILTHILSLIDTRTAVQTSVLSKRYRFLWTSLPSLNFYYFGQSRLNFTSLVDHVLGCRDDTNLTGFRLSLYKEVAAGCISDCISYAVRHKVQNLSVRAYTKHSLITLTNLFNASSSLRTLRLTNATSCNIELPKSVSLPELKVLMLKNFEFSSQNYNADILFGCPNLETLILNKCLIRKRDYLKALNVNCPNLKHLEIRYWRSVWEHFDEYVINVTAPKLVSFKFQGHLMRVNFKRNLLCLDTVCADLCYPTACKTVNVSHRRRRTAQSFIYMLGRLCNVKSLFVSLKTIEALSSIPNFRKFPISSIFRKLRYIKFTVKDKYTEMNASIDTVAQLLKRANTKFLVFSLTKEQILSINLKPPSMKSRHKDANPITIPTHLMSHILESSPSAEVLVIELPKAASD